MFYIIAVGMSFGMDFFRQAVFESSREIAQFPTEHVDPKYPGYIRIDSSAIRKKNPKIWQDFVDKIQNGLLVNASYKFSSRVEFEGGLAEKMAFEIEGFLFSFHIKQYERDSDHGFEIFDPEYLADIPEDENIGRVVYLEVKPTEE